MGASRTRNQNTNSFPNKAKKDVLAAIRNFICAGSIALCWAAVGTGNAMAAGVASVAITPNFNPSAEGQTIVFTARVTATGSTPTGVVDFFDGSTPICAGVALASSLVPCATSTLVPGAHSITAIYRGDSSYAAVASIPWIQTINREWSDLLLVTKSGGGDGTVVSSPPGIACGSQCRQPYAFAADVTLIATPTASSAFTGWSGPCSGTGECRVKVSGITSVSATFAPKQDSPFHLDIDGNKAYDPLTDGLLIVRYLFGIRGAAMTSGALGVGATRTDPAEITARLDNFKLALDVDGNGVVEALTDGLMIFRYMIGLRGDGLVARNVGAGATRVTAAQIEAYLKALMPLPIPSRGNPMTGPEKTWTFVPFPESVCDEGSPTGIGINLSTTSNGVLIFLNGGGACWDESTCSDPTNAVRGPFGAAEFNRLTPTLSTEWIFNRADATNAFKDYSFVFVPYCTGDWHAGNNVAQYGGRPYRHKGYANLAAFLDRIVPTFPSAGPVVLAGTSAGGYGATFNWWQTQQRFGGTRVHMIDDSGVLMPPEIVDPTRLDERARRFNWNLDATLPPGCQGCASSLDKIFSFYATALPNNRAALISHAQDPTIADYYEITPTQFAAGLVGVVGAQIRPNANFRSFILSGSGHSSLKNSSQTATSGGVPLTTFIRQMVNDDPAW